MYQQQLNPRPTGGLAPGVIPGVTQAGMVAPLAGGTVPPRSVTPTLTTGGIPQQVRMWTRALLPCPNTEFPSTRLARQTQPY